jgi:hypothetical protein
VHRDLVQRVVDALVHRVHALERVLQRELDRVCDARQLADPRQVRQVHVGRVVHRDDPHGLGRDARRGERVSDELGVRRLRVRARHAAARQHDAAVAQLARHWVLRDVVRRDGAPAAPALRAAVGRQAHLAVRVDDVALHLRVQRRG